jgi:hypothetical protein
VSNASNDQCAGFYPFLGDKDATSSGVTVAEGVVTYSSLTAECFPGKTITVEFKALLKDLAEVSTVEREALDVVQYVPFTFRYVLYYTYNIRLY